MTNSLQALFPEIAQQWHPTKNGCLTPDQVVAGTNTKFWWKCDKGSGHEWDATSSHRTGRGQGCPYCTIVPRSKVEIYIAFELNGLIDFRVEEHRLRIEGKLLDIDILVRPLRLAVEFDGSYWHREKQERDKEKTAKLIQSGWRVIRVRESPLEKITASDIVVANNIGPKSLKPVMDQLLRQIELVCDFKIPGLAKYLRRKKPARTKAAETHIQQLLEEKAQQNNDD